MEKDKIPPPPVPAEINNKRKPEVVVQKDVKFLNNGLEEAPPSAVDIERVILGAFLIDGKTIPYIALLESEVFFLHQHHLIFSAIKNLYEEGMPIDLLTVGNELKRSGNIAQIGGDYYLIQLTQMVATGAHIDFHIHIILQKYVLREMIVMSSDVIKQSLFRDPDIFKLKEGVENKLARIENIAMRRTNDESKDAKEELKNKVQMQREGLSFGYTTGISEFDEWRGGFMKRWLVTIAARPGMGKTTAVISMIIHMVINKGISVLFFSLEMPAIDLKYKLAAALTGIDFDKINSGKLSDQEYEMVEAAIDKIDESPLEIVDNEKNLDKILSTTRKKVAAGAEVVFLDYVQLVETSDNRDETGKLTKVTRSFRALKNELNIPFIQLAQLSREVDKRKGHRPQLSDLKMSGSLEEDSNMVIFILRPEYYNENKSKVPIPPGQVNPEFIGEWIVAKGRETGTRDFDIYLDFLKSKMESFSGIQF